MSTCLKENSQDTIDQSHQEIATKTIKDKPKFSVAKEIISENFIGKKIFRNGKLSFFNIQTTNPNKDVQNMI